MIRAITMLRVADCYGPMPYSQVKKGNFYVSYDTQEQVYTNILSDLANAADVLYNYYVETNGNAPLGANDPVLREIIPVGRNWQIQCAYVLQCELAEHGLVLLRKRLKLQ